MNIEYYKNKYEPIDGKWFINKKLGSGAFGTVLEIERRDQTNMKAALKIVSVPSNPSEVENYREENYKIDEQSISSYFYGFVEEFTKEIQLMSEIRGHGNIVTIEDYDIKKHTDGIGWDIFIRMELLTPMNKYFRDNPPKTRDVIKLGIDICKALEVCQKFNIVHRDIKPSNIFVSDSGEFKLGDFGVARTLEKTTSGLSKKGTYTYMAPEVYRGEENYDSSVDIYSLGIVMYKLLNNNFEPFRTQLTESDETASLRSRMKNEQMPNPANASDDIAKIILKACSYCVQERFASAHDMRMALETIIDIDKPNSDDKNTPPFRFNNEYEPTIGIFDQASNDKFEMHENNIDTNKNNPPRLDHCQACGAEIPKGETLCFACKEANEKEKDSVDDTIICPHCLGTKIQTFVSTGGFVAKYWDDTCGVCNGTGIIKNDENGAWMKASYDLLRHNAKIEGSVSADCPVCHGLGQVVSRSKIFGFCGPKIQQQFKCPKCFGGKVKKIERKR